MSRCRQSFLLIGIVGAWLFHMNMQHSWSRDNVEVICERQSPSAPICAYNGNGRHPRILILGAGMSGISAAQALIDLGYTDLMILEGSDRIGGRLRDVKLGDYTIETGAQFIHGTGDNPVYTMAKDKEELTLVKTDYSDFVVRDSQGKDVTDFAQPVLETFRGFCNNYSSPEDINGVYEDVSLFFALEKHCPQSDSDLVAALEYFVFDFELATPPKTTSFKFWEPTISYTQHNVTHIDDMVVSDARGYASIVQNMVQEMMFRKSVNIKLRHEVSRIQQGQDYATVETRDHKRFTADIVIVTFSLGVLQERSVIFQPRLPKLKMDAIDRFEMTYYTHVFLQFPAKFWDNTEYIVYAGQRRGYFTVWRNLDKSLPGCNILQVAITGEDAKQMEQLSDNDVIHKAMAVLRSMYSTRGSDIPYPISHYIPRWYSDPLFRGSFSNWPVGYDEQTFEHLSKSVGRIFFAGEHTDLNHLGFVHGSFYSGKRVAAEIDNFVKGIE